MNLVWGRRCGFQPSLAISWLFGWGTPWHPHLEFACRFCHNCHSEWLESPHFQVRIPIMSVFQVSRYCSTWYQAITCWGNGRRLQIYLDIETENFSVPVLRFWDETRVFYNFMVWTSSKLQHHIFPNSKSHFEVSIQFLDTHTSLFIIWACLEVGRPQLPYS